MPREYELFLDDMLDAAERLQSKLAGVSLQQLESDRDLQDIVIRNVILLGEAAANIPEAVREKNAGVDWRNVKGMRNRVVHHYFGINWELVISAVEEVLPGLIEELRCITRDESSR